MEEPQMLEPTKHEKDHIFQLVKRAGRKTSGTVINDLAELHSWAGVSNGFDARFLAKYFDCKLLIPSYTDPVLLAKLEGWLAWYRKRTGKEEAVTSFLSAPSKPNLTKKSRSKHTKWDHECLACKGYGTIQNTTEASNKCDICDGTGWMSSSQYESYQNKMKATLAGNQWQRLPGDEGWKKSRIICNVCGGDGGASGQCYKCEGSGWLFSN